MKFNIFRNFYKPKHQKPKRFLVNRNNFIPSVEALEIRDVPSTVIINATGNDSSKFTITNDDSDPQAFYGTKFTSKLENGIAVFYLQGNVEIRSGDTISGTGGKPISLRVSNNVSIPKDAIFQMSGGISQTGGGPGATQTNNGGSGGSGGDPLDNGGGGGSGLEKMSASTSSSTRSDKPHTYYRRDGGVDSFRDIYYLDSPSTGRSGSSGNPGEEGLTGVNGLTGISGSSGFGNPNGLGLGGKIFSPANNGGTGSNGFNGIDGSTGRGGSNINIDPSILSGGGGGGSGSGGQGGGQGSQGTGGKGGTGGSRGLSVFFDRATLVNPEGFGLDERPFTVGGYKGGNGGRGGSGGEGGIGGQGGIGGPGGSGGGALEIRALGRIVFNGSLLAIGGTGGSGLPGAGGANGKAGSLGGDGLPGDLYPNDEELSGQPGQKGNKGGTGFQGGQGGKGGAGGGGAGGTIKLVATALDVGTGSINASGGNAGDNQSAGKGGNGRFIFGDNVSSTFSGKVTGATVINTTGSREVNPFSSSKDQTPFIPNLQGGAEIYGLTQLSPSDFASLQTASTSSGGALLRLQTGPGIYSTAFAGFDYLFFINKSTTSIQSPKLGFGGDNFTTSLISRGSALNPNFGGNGPLTLSSLSPNGVYVTLIPKSANTFSASLQSSGISSTTSTSKLEYNKPLFLNMAPAITSGTTAGLIAGQPGKVSVTAVGNPMPTFSLATPPSAKGLTFDSVTGNFSTTKDTPLGTYKFVVSARNSVGKSADQNVEIMVGTVPAFTNPNKGTLIGGVPGIFAFQATGSPKPLFFLQNNYLVDPGFSLNSNTGVLSITAKTPVGIYSIPVKLSNGIGDPLTQDFTLTVAKAPTITNSSIGNFLSGKPATVIFTATGLPAPSFSVPVDKLPKGAVLDSLTGKLSIPSSATAGIYSFDVSASNGIGSPAKQNFTLVLGQTPSFTGALSANFLSGKAGTFTIKSSGIPSPTFDGSPPANVATIDSKTGVLTTKATAPGGVYTFDVTSTNSIGQTKTFFTLTIGSIPTITSSALAGFATGFGGSFAVVAKGSPAAKFTLIQAKPLSGITIDAITGILSVAASVPVGTYSLSINATNDFGTAKQIFTLTVGTAPAFTGATTAIFKIGQVNTYNVTATGSPKPTFVLQQKDLDLLKSLGLSFNATTGVLTGKALAGKAGTYKFGITAANGLGRDTAQIFTLVIS